MVMAGGGAWGAASHGRAHLPPPADATNIGRGGLMRGLWTCQVLGFNPLVAPVKCLLAPLSSKAEFEPALQQIGAQWGGGAISGDRPAHQVLIHAHSAARSPAMATTAQVTRSVNSVWRTRWTTRQTPLGAATRGTSPTKRRNVWRARVVADAGLLRDLGRVFADGQGGRAGHSVRRHGRLPNGQGWHRHSARARHHQAADPRAGVWSHGALPSPKPGALTDGCRCCAVGLGCTQS